MKTVRVLHVRVGYRPQAKAVVDDLVSYQKLVGGYIQPTWLEDGVTLFSNEEALVLELRYNRGVRDARGELTHIHGDFFIVREKAGAMESLTDDDVHKYTQELK